MKQQLGKFAWSCITICFVAFCLLLGVIIVNQQLTDAIRSKNMTMILTAPDGTEVRLETFPVSSVTDSKINEILNLLKLR